RDVAAAEFIDVALKRAIASGKVVGPRLFVAGQALSVTGGHGDLSGFSPYLHFDNFNGVVDGVDEIRKKIRWQVKNGVDLTKFCATAGVLSEEGRSSPIFIRGDESHRGRIRPLGTQGCRARPRRRRHQAGG